MSRSIGLRQFQCRVGFNGQVLFLFTSLWRDFLYVLWFNPGCCWVKGLITHFSTTGPVVFEWTCMANLREFGCAQWGLLSVAYRIVIFTGTTNYRFFWIAGEKCANTNNVNNVNNAADQKHVKLWGGKRCSICWLLPEASSVLLTHLWWYLPQNSLSLKPFLHYFQVVLKWL